MPIWLDTRGRSTLGIGICARCSRKMSLDELHDDPNFPGLRVCDDDTDQYDPYRLPARETEDITLQYPRPDVSLALQHLGLCAEDDNSFMITDDGIYYIVP